MKILVLNGSPKGERSNTMELTKAFCEGIGQRVEIQTEIVPVYQKKIQDCLGCFRCWSVTPGTCCLQDDVAGIIEQILEADGVFLCTISACPPGLRLSWTGSCP